MGNATVAVEAQELALQIASERAAIRDAIARTQAGQQEPQEAHTEITHLFAPEDLPASAAIPVPEAPASRKRTLAVLLGVLFALVAGVAVGAEFGGGHADASPTVPSATPPVTVSLGPLPPVAVFERPQVPEDIPGIEFQPYFDAASFRLLSGYSVSGEGVPSQVVEAVYAAKTTSNMVCVVVVPTDPTYVYTCTLEGDFPSTGLRVHWADEAQIESATGTPVTRTERYVVWNVDQSVEWGSTGR